MAVAGFADNRNTKNGRQLCNGDAYITLGVTKYTFWMSPETVEKLALVALAWLLGLLGPVIVEAIRRRRENAMGRAALLSELREVGCILVTAAFGVHNQRGTTDRAFLEWMKTDLERHAISPDFKKFIPTVSKMLEWSDADIANVATHMAAPEGVGTVLQKYPVPLLDGRVSALWTFDTGFQRDLLAIRQNIHLLDDLVDRSRKYHDMTFNKSEGDNHQRITGNINLVCDLYAQRAVRTVKLIRLFTEHAE